MILIFKLIILTSIWCIGLFIVTQEGMLLYSFRKWAEKENEKGMRVTEALIICPWCLPSIHAMVGYFFAVIIGIVDHFEFKFVLIYPLVVMGSSIVCGSTWTLIEYFSAKTEYYKKLNNEIENSSEEIRSN